MSTRIPSVPQKKRRNTVFTAAAAIFILGAFFVAYTALSSQAPKTMEPAPPPVTESFEQIVLREERAANARHRSGRSFTSWRAKQDAAPQQQHNAVVAAPAATEGVTQCEDGLVYHDWFMKLLLDNFGRVVADAVYHPEIFNVMAKSLDDLGSGGYRFRDHDDEFELHDLSDHPTKPDMFDTPAKMLWWAKRWTTIGLSKISRDSELQRLFLRLCTDPERKLKMKFLEKPTLQAMSAQIQYFFTVMQLAIDVNLSQDTKRAYSDLVKGHRGMDVLVLVSGWFNHSAPISAVHQLLESPDALADVVKRRIEAVQNEPAKNSQSVFTLNYDDKTYFDSLQSNSKFWSMLRPTAGCSTTTRICENAEGCRYVCNPEYLLYAGRRDGSSAADLVQTPPYHHRIIGMGSNNEYAWELSLLSLFGGTSALSKEKAHRIGWLTAFDCTVTVAAGDRQWNVPAALKEAPVGFTAASVCGGGARKQAHDYLAAKAVKSLQLKLEATWGQEFIGQPIMRFKAHPESLEATQRRGTDLENHGFVMSQKTSNGKHLISPRWFDALTILKVDTTGTEWKLIPAWIRGEMYGVGAHSPARTIEQGSTDVVDFDAVASNFFTVSLFSLQFHRLGMGEEVGYSAAGALRAHWLSLQTQALGFMMVAHESDERGHCCYENTYVHVRHFIKSEVWMALRDDL
jgi:hypothetical protein